MYYADEYEKRDIERFLEQGEAVSLPAGGPITKGPVLCLDIDGVVSPCAQDRRFNINAYPEGFINVEGAISYPVQVHPALPRWLAALEEHFTTCLWVTTWRYRARWLMDALELAGPAGWPYILPIDTPHFPGDHIDFYKLEAARAWVDPAVPVAVVDDHLGGLDSWDRGCASKEDVDAFLTRPGPALLLAPDEHIGLTDNIVDELCRFARDPNADEFAGRTGVACRDSDRRIQWPWEVSDSKYGGITNPVTVEHCRNPEWETEREAAQKWRRAYLDECQEREWAEKKLKTYEEEAKKRLIHRLKAGWRQFFSSP